MCISEEFNDAVLEEIKLMVEDSILQIMKETGQTREQAETTWSERLKEALSFRREVIE